MSVTVFNAPAENNIAKLHNMIDAISTFANVYQKGKELGLQKDQLEQLKKYQELDLATKGARKANKGEEPGKNEKLFNLNGQDYILGLSPEQQVASDQKNTQQAIEASKIGHPALGNIFGNIVDPQGPLRNMLLQRAGIPSNLSGSNGPSGNFGMNGPMSMANGIMSLFGGQGSSQPPLNVNPSSKKSSSFKVTPL